MTTPPARRTFLRATAVLPLAFAATVAAAASARQRQEEPAPTAVARMKREAEALRPFVRSDLAKRFLAATATALPAIAPRTVYRDPATKAVLPRAEADKLSDEARKALEPVTLNEDRYYDTKYGTPLAYARALDLAGTVGGIKDIAGQRVLDFGYGTVGHLRLLASLGAEAVGVDVDPFLALLYGEPGDTGVVPAAAPGGKPGKVSLVHGRWPAEETARAAVGQGGYDLFLSKNTLKNGYLHPERPVDKRMLVDLGVSDEAFVAALRDLLNPGGIALIYNLSPAPAKLDEPYRPWADGRSPFPRALWEKSGFEVLAFDAGDDVPAREMACLLRWHEPPMKMDLEKDLFAHYTLARRRPG
jgi:hypothetical protein